MFALARTYTAFKRLPSAKGCWLYVYVHFFFIVITTGVTPLPDSSTPQDDGRGSRRCFRRSQPFGPDSLSTASHACSAAPNSHRHAPGILGRPSYAPPAPGVFRGATATGLTNFRRHQRSSPHRGPRGHCQPNGHQYGGAARLAQRT
ncbi:hypothetical protein CDL15_Pgr019164 [Punica granatum]|uniref:Uncharacterized protein n=1 Tax=Punica granatum TaxID=22663 RepID=A0A218WEF5_PUNGR|nr:hypothetical protein CDL15_Pgr019164 [Punica granatum]